MKCENNRRRVTRFAHPLWVGIAICHPRGGDRFARHSESAAVKIPVIAVLACLASALPADAAIIHVPAEYPEIQAGLMACQPGDTVLVSAGTYVENITWPSTHSICLTSESGPESTIIDGGSPSNPDTGSVVVFAAGLDANTVLEGFTITHGTGTRYPGFNAYAGGGILCDSTSPSIVGNVITRNTERVDVGAGIHCINECSPLISGNTISDNRANYPNWGYGGGIMCYIAAPTIANNIITRNSALVGSGIYQQLASGVVSGNEITENTAPASDSYGGGLHLNTDSSSITGNAIISNRAGRGGGIRLTRCSSTIVENEIRGNIADIDGGGIQSTYESIPTIVDNDIVDNVSPPGHGGGISYFFNAAVGDDVGGSESWVIGTRPLEHSAVPRSYGHIGGNLIAGNAGGGIRCSIGSPTIEHCRIVNNIGVGIVCESGASPQIHYNDISGHTPSYGMFNVSTTVLINAEDNFWGHPSGPYHPLTNPSGLGDLVSDYIDYAPWSSSSAIAEAVAEPGWARLMIGQNRPNPFNPVTTIEYVLPEASAVTLKVYDVLGREVARLVEGSLPAGPQRVMFDGTGLPSGRYFYRIQAGSFTEARSMTLAK